MVFEERTLKVKNTHVVAHLQVIAGIVDIIIEQDEVWYGQVVVAGKIVAFRFPSCAVQGAGRREH